MRPIFKILTSSAWLLLCVILAAQAANAQKRYPPFEEAWDAILASGTLLYGIAVDDAHHFKRPWDPNALAAPGP